MRQIAWYALMGFCISILLLFIVALFVDEHEGWRMSYVLNIVIYSWAIHRGWTKRQNWLN